VVYGIANHDNVSPNPPFSGVDNTGCDEAGEKRVRQGREISVDPIGGSSRGKPVNFTLTASGVTTGCGEVNMPTSFRYAPKENITTSRLYDRPCQTIFGIRNIKRQNNVMIKVRSFLGAGEEFTPRSKKAREEKTGGTGITGGVKNRNPSLAGINAIQSHDLGGAGGASAGKNQSEKMFFSSSLYHGKPANRTFQGRHFAPPPFAIVVTKSPNRAAPVCPHIYSVMRDNGVLGAAPYQSASGSFFQRDIVENGFLSAGQNNKTREQDVQSG